MGMTTLSDQLTRLMRRSGVGAQTLSKLTGIPRTAIDNWRDGTVRRPRHWRPLVQLARTLGLPAEETDALLAAAGYGTTSDLAGALAEGHPDRALLAPWLLVAPDRSSLRHQLRGPAGDFVGRDEVIAQLLTALGRGGDAVAIAGLRGMGGIGKTETAILVANRLRGAYPDGQLFVSLGGVGPAPMPAGQALRQVLHVFAADSAAPDNVEDLQRRYCAALSGLRVLVVADDAHGANQVRPLLPPPGCALLVTARRRFSLPGMVSIDLDTLTETESVTLLETLCDRITVEDAQAIARACGHLPLALRAAGSVLANDPALTVDEYLVRLRDERRRLPQLRDPEDASLDVGASLALSVAALDETTRQVFAQLGVLTGDFTTELASATVAADSTTMPDALHRLLRNNLIMYDPARGRWRLHDLVRDLACQRLTAEGRLADTMWRYAETATRLAQNIHELHEAGGDKAAAALARFDLERPHIDAARAWATANAGHPDADRLLVADSLFTYGPAFARYDLRRENLPQTQEALAAARRLGDRPGQIRIHNRLGRLHHELGQFEQASGHFSQQLTLAEAVGDTVRQAHALNNLSVTAMQRGRPREAINYNEQQLRVVRAVADTRGEAMALCNLGWARMSVGDTERAIADLQRALTLARDIGDRYGEGIILQNLGMTYRISGDHDRAADLLERALTYAIDTGDHFAEAEVRSDLARALVVAGDAAAAQMQADRALSLAGRLGARHCEANAVLALGVARAAGGQTALAQEALERAMRQYSELGDRRGQAECAWHLGLLLTGMDPTRAGQLLAVAVDYEREVGHAQADEHAALVAGMATRLDLPET
jgi:tetratricopeptide (TPR) repeat protein